MVGPIAGHVALKTRAARSLVFLSPFVVSTPLALRIVCHDAVLAVSWGTPRMSQTVSSRARARTSATIASTSLPSHWPSMTTVAPSAFALSPTWRHHASDPSPVMVQRSLTSPSSTSPAAAAFRWRVPMSTATTAVTYSVSG